MKSWHCRCGWAGQTEDKVIAAFHPCGSPGRHSDLSLIGSLPDDSEERRSLWASLLFSLDSGTRRGEGAA